MKLDLDRLAEQAKEAFQDELGIEPSRVEISSWPDETFAILWIPSEFETKHGLWSARYTQGLDDRGIELVVIVRSETEFDEEVEPQASIPTRKT